MPSSQRPTARMAKQLLCIFVLELRPSLFHALSCSLPQAVLALAMQKATSSSNVANLERVLPVETHFAAEDSF